MSCDFKLAVPLLIFNLGGEMVYILEQRLDAQKIAGEKSTKVLEDVISTMFHEKFVKELFQSTELPTSRKARGIFNHLAHSSIMRLSKSSMDKLYDLMTMGVKYQLLSCTHAGQIMDVTFNHMNNLMKLVEHNTQITSQIATTLQLITERFTSLRAGNQCHLRQCLFRFFQDRRVKVSLFLQENIQRTNGTIVIKANGPVPPLAEVPGFIRYNDDSGNIRTAAFEYNGGAEPYNSSDECTLGINMYLKRKSDAKDNDKDKDTMNAGKGASSTSAHSTSKSNSTSTTDSPGSSRTTGSEELNHLATLIGSLAGQVDEGSKFQVELFKDADDFDTVDVMSLGGGTIDIETTVMESKKMTHSSSRQVNAQLANILDDMNDTPSNDAGTANGEEEDLFDLLDG